MQIKLLSYRANPLTVFLDESFEQLVNGDLDDLPEQAFAYVGSIEEAVEKAEKLAAEAA